MRPPTPESDRGTRNHRNALEANADGVLGGRASEEVITHYITFRLQLGVIRITEMLQTTFSIAD